MSKSFYSSTFASFISAFHMNKIQYFESCHRQVIRPSGSVSCTSCHASCNFPVYITNALQTMGSYSEKSCVTIVRVEPIHEILKFKSPLTL